METSNVEPNDFKNTFSSINERPVDDISLEFFYKPHTITLLAVSIAAVIYTAFVRDESSTQDNIWSGICCVVFFFLIISVLTFPNGPFTRPHPALWRIVFGMSVLYLLALLFLLFQSYSTVYAIMYWIDPNLKNFHIDMDKEYAVNCSDLSLSKIWSHVDVFAWGHFFGWMFKAVLFRHAGLLWAISIMWEITEIAFAHLLPNFLECWWDSIILDVLICNGLGIWCGLKICKALEMREYKWVSIRDISSTTGKIKRAILQFTPVQWTPVRWLDPTCTYMRFFALSQLVVFWQISELNTFFLKHIFEMPPSHPLVIARLCLIGVIVAPSVRQYYTFVTDPKCKRVGTQCWVYGAIMVTESMLCIKNGKELFGQAQVCNVIVWLVIQILVSVGCVYGVVLYHRYFEIQEDCADIHGMSQQTLSHLCKKVAIALAHQSPIYTKMPTNLSAEIETIRNFEAISRFPHVTEAIDCTHIKIRKVGGDAGQHYVNRKGHYSINTQVVRNASLKICDIVLGSTHDARIFRELLKKKVRRTRI